MFIQGTVDRECNRGSAVQARGSRLLHLRREAVLVQAVLLLVAADARQFGKAEAAAHSGQFGLGGWRHSLTSADALLLVHWNNKELLSHYKMDKPWRRCNQTQVAGSTQTANYYN